MTRQRSEPIFLVRVKRTGSPSGTAGSAASSVPPAVAKAAHDLALAKEELAIYEKNKAAGGDPNADAKVAGAASRVKEREADLAAARKAGGPVNPSPGAVGPGVAASDLEYIDAEILSFEYQDDEKKTDLLKLTIDNRDLRHFDEAFVMKGQQLIVSWGYPGEMCPDRLVVVQKVSGFFTITVEAQDKGVLAQKETFSRVWENVRRSDVVRIIARDFLGYRDDQVIIEETEQVLPVVTQAAQTDGQFLRKLADLEGFEYYVDADGLHWHPRRLGQRPIRRLTYYVNPGVGDIIKLNVDDDAKKKHGAVTQAGRDPLAKTDIKATANADNTKRDTTGAKQEIGAPPPAVTYTQRVDPTSGQVTTTYAAPPKTPSDGVSAAATVPSSATTAKDAQTQAAAGFRTSQQSVIKLSGELVGDPFIAAKTILEIDGIGSRMSGRYYLTSVTHKIDSSGYVTSFKAHTDGSGKGGPGGQGKAAKPNQKDAPPDKKNDAPAPLAMFQKVDPQTGKTVTEYRDAQGRVPQEPQKG